MIKIGDVLTTKAKKEYPCTVEVREINSDGTSAKCLCSDPSGETYNDYELSTLRHLSAKELFCDVFTYYGIAGPSEKMDFYSNKHIAWLKSYIQSEKDAHEMIEKDCEKEGIDIADLPSSELYEYDMTGERAAWMSEVVALIEKEIAEVKKANLSEEISARFAAALENDEDELDFYMDLLADDIDVNAVRCYMGDECVSHMRAFCEEHGLLDTAQNTVCISLSCLYHSGHQHLQYGGEIARSTEDGNEFFDLLKDGPEHKLLLCDGEEVRILRKTEDIVFVENPETKCRFLLTAQEFGIATFGVEV